MNCKIVGYRDGVVPDRNVFHGREEMKLESRAFSGVTLYGNFPMISKFPGHCSDHYEKNLVIKTEIDSGDTMIHINDTGTGISEDHISKIFAPDFTTKPVGKGTGLGLSSVKEMLDKHSGTIRIESRLGKGTQVTIRLQAKDDKEASVFF